MNHKIKQIIESKQISIGIIVFIIIMIILITLTIYLKYNMIGEKNLPFNLSKISIISSIKGEDMQDEINKWNIAVNQNNDIYLYITKNNEYKNKETEAIVSVTINNFNVVKKPEVGTLKLYKPSNNKENFLFKNIAENQVDSINFIGSTESDINNLKISNQGGLVVFRYSIEDLGRYISNEDTEINHDDLLKKLKIRNENLKFNVTADIEIKLKSNLSYKANLNFDLPVGNVVENGTQSKEDIDLSNVIFKRENK